MKTRALIPLISVFAAVALPTVWAADENLYETFSRRPEVKVYVAPATDATAEKKTDLPGLKTALEKAFTERASIHFKTVPSKEEADIAVETEVTEYFWTDHDPIDMIVGLGGTAYDAATVENYVRMQARVSVRDVKTGRVLWTKSVLESVTDKSMTQADAPGRINSDFAKGLMKQAFSKRRSSDRR